MEETETSKTKASDSAYSNSSTSQYQRSNGSSKSRHSNSSGSSGYCGRPSVLSSGNDEGFPQPQTSTKRKEKKRKQQHKAMDDCLSSSSFWDRESEDGLRPEVNVGAAGTVGAAAIAAGGVAAAPGDPSVVAAAATASAMGGPAAVTIGGDLGAPGKMASCPLQEGVGGGPVGGGSSAGGGTGGGGGAQGGENEALQMAALTQTLHCIKKMKGKENALKCLQGDNNAARASGSGSLDCRVKEHLASCFKRESSSPQEEGEGFMVVVSMADGTVVHTTPSLSTCLGFPSDMWLGRDFIDFVHPKDRMAFASHITSGVARGETSSCKGMPTKTSFYCSLRQYRGLRNVGYGVTRKQVPYLPFCLAFTFREMNMVGANSPLVDGTPEPVAPHSPPTPLTSQNLEKFAVAKEVEEMNGSVFIVITATRIYPAYKAPNEEIAPSQTSKKSPPPQSPGASQSQGGPLQPPHTPEISLPCSTPVGKFVTRHLSSCYLSHVDPVAVRYLGYLPQDMESRSVMDFYHPEDMSILKEAYQNIMSQQSSPFKGKPYRFRTQNGCYILVETEWSSFVNPWSRKLEFVIGQHHVLKGPSNPDVFAEAVEEDCPQFSDEVLKENEQIQKEIMFMLDQKVTRVSESARQQVSKRCRDLASFMETLMDEMAKPADPLRVELPVQDEDCFSERDSVMLGEISPHHDYYDGKSSTETPPSYNQLNYNENLQRFFESKPKTTLSDESSEMKMEGSIGNNRSPLSTDEEGKSCPIAMDSSSASGGDRKCCSRANESESGGSGPPRGAGTGARGCCQGDHDPGGGGGKAGVGGNAKFKGSRRPQALEGSAAKGGRVLTLNQEKGRRASGHPSNGTSYQAPHLTEALLSRHNEDMEKIMVQKHREQRSLDREGKLKDGRKGTYEKAQEPPIVSHGVKRSGSHSLEGEPQRIKHQHIEHTMQPGNQQSGVGGHQPWEQLPLSSSKVVPITTSAPAQGSAAPVNTSTSSGVPRSTKLVQPSLRVPVVEPTSSPLPSLNHWAPPFSVTLTPMNSTQPCLTYSCPAMPQQHQHHEHHHPMPTLQTSSAPPPSIVVPAPPSTPSGPELPHQHHHPLVPMQQHHHHHHHPFPHPHNPLNQPYQHHHHPQGLLPVYYVPAAASPAGVTPTPVDAENSGAQSRLLSYPHQQVQLPPVGGFPYLVPAHYSQVTAGLPSLTGAPYVPNHPQYMNSVPQVVYQTLGVTQGSGLADAQQLFTPALNAFVPAGATPSSYHPPHLSAPPPPTAEASAPLLPPRPPSSAPNPQCPTRVRRPTRNHQGHHPLLHHLRLQQPQATTSAIKAGISRQGNLLRWRDGLGFILVADRDTLSSTSGLNKGQLGNEEEYEEKGESPLVFSECQRPSSQATSIKAEPGSAVGSIASASRLRDLLEVSKCKSIGSSGMGKDCGVGVGCEGEEEDEEGVLEDEKEDEEEEERMGGGRKAHKSSRDLGSKDRRNRDITHAFSLLHDPETICDDSSYSSLYSFLRTENSDESMRSYAWDSRTDAAIGCNDIKGDIKSWGSKSKGKGANCERNSQKLVRKGPSWLEEVDVTPDLIFRYKMDDQILCNVLEADLKALKTISQSSTVNEQLSQLYMDMELEGATTRLSLEDSSGFTSSSGTDEASVPLNAITMSPSSPKISRKSKKKRRSMDYGKLVMIFEENAPFPPPAISTYGQ